MSKPILLAILDGLGLAEGGPNNAFDQAHTPVLDRLMENGYAQLQASGEAVGLPDGQMGNSEVGHTNIGAGRVVYQELTRITRDAKTARWRKTPFCKKAFCMRRITPSIWSGSYPTAVFTPIGIISSPS